MATTIRELINHLNEIEDKNQSVVYQYYVAEHFEVSKKRFAKVAEIFDSLLPHDYSVIAETVADTED